MGRMLLFEAGSTKTTLLECCSDANITTQEQIKETMLPGFNPNRNQSDFIEALKGIKIGADDQVFFYGSGLGSNERKTELVKLFKNQYEIEINVFDDIIGAARALLGTESGVFAIMGTGGVVGYYDGGKVIERKGGYGFLIDDIGGGYELGKRLVSFWLNGDLPAELSDDLETFFRLDRKEFVQTYYSQAQLRDSAQGLKMIAESVRLIPAYLENEIVKEIVMDYFTDFFRRHVASLCRNRMKSELYICGSLAEFFYESIQLVAVNFGLIVKNTMQFPAFELLKFHQNELRMIK